MDSDFCPLTLSDEEIEVLRTLRKLSDADGFEYGQICSSVGFSEPFSSNNENSVLIPDKYQNSGQIRLYHSHTNETLFSRRDYSLLLARYVERISVITTTGEIFSAYVGTGVIPDKDEFWNAVTDIHQAVVFDMIDQSGFFDLEPRQMEILTYREIAFRIARHFKWTLEGGTP